jgi:5'-deoxynucleotidase YfbR-like HD superfamily hydrolase
MVQKHDQYSHLAVKALINSGMDGLRAVFDELETSNDPEADRRMLKDALDHVNFEDGLDAYLKQKIEASKQPVVKEFAQKILDEYAGSEEGSPEAMPE